MPPHLVDQPHRLLRAEARADQVGDRAQPEAAVERRRGALAFGTRDVQPVLHRLGLEPPAQHRVDAVEPVQQGGAVRGRGVGGLGVAQQRGPQPAARVRPHQPEPDPEGEPVEDIRKRFAGLRELGKEEFDREFEIWTSCWVICRPTQAEAERYRDYVLEEKGDLAVLDSMPPNLVPRGDGPEARLARQKVLGGFGGVHLVGTPERIVDRLAEIAQAGADGVVLSFVNFEEGLTTWMSDVTPLLVQAGLRQ